MGRSGQVWPRAWIVCSLGQLAVRAESKTRLSRAVHELPIAEVRTSAGLSPVPGMGPGT